MTTPKSEAVEELNDALRKWYASFNDLGRRYAQHLHMHGSDAAAILEITAAETRNEPLTQTDLARRLGLSTNATSTLLSRLEDAGHIERHRSRTDRRIVLLQATPQVHQDVQDFFRDVGRDTDQVMLSHGLGELRSLTALVSEMTSELDRHLVRLTRSP